MRERITGGLASGRRPRDFNAEQLRRGTRVELEHVVRPGRKPTKRDRELAREIAMDHLVEDPRYYTMLAKAEKRMKTRNKYDFKWWHGVLGLIGLSMVLGTVQALARADRQPPMLGTTYEVRVRPSGFGFAWDIVDSAGNVVETGVAMTESEARGLAQEWIDASTPARNAIAAEPLKYLHPSQRRLLAGAVGHGPRTVGPARLTTPPWDGHHSWQDKWDRFTR
jgi:hypothetical protein